MTTYRFNGVHRDSDAVVSRLALSGHILSTADKSGTVNGHVETFHSKTNHPADCFVEITFYDAAEAPTAEHTTTISKSGTIPSRTAVQTAVTAAV